MNERRCLHDFTHAVSQPYRVLCDGCGAEVQSAGYWPGEALAMETVITEPVERAETKAKKRARYRAETVELNKPQDGWIPSPWPTRENGLW